MAAAPSRGRSVGARLAGQATVLVAALVTVAPARATEDPALERALRVLQRAPVIDGHNDLPWAIRESKQAPRDVPAYDLRRTTPGHTDLARLRAGRVGGQFWSVYIPGDVKAQGYAKVQLEQIDIARRIIAGYPEALFPAATAEETRRAMREGKIASLLGMEGGHAIENSLGALRAFFDLGVRYMTLTHNVTLDWADAANDVRRHGGLNGFGEEVVREMNRLGMLVDLSHVSPETMEDALRVSEAPVIFSHSSCRALCDVPRNVPDAVLRELPRNGGVIMITFVSGFLSPEFASANRRARAALAPLTKGVSDPSERERISREYFRHNPLPKVPLSLAADHIEHARKVAGVDHIGLGGDFDGNDDWPVGLEDVAAYPRLFAELVRRGWSDAHLEKLAQGNILRVMERAEAVAARLRAERPASTATLESRPGARP